ncbi:cyclic nucleotide-gated cation channel alpha-3 [Octopus bimaculoides]|uniref:cyclic nucleotide-gated cation channel alpha-3 n=1 Tax=Octopus bimaculoides TaxID=37653 RepID=UPI0022E5442F|nr:cyclic nucleotide-gated cation channel alpha-3 [Octopus bimaculoides]
MSSVLTRRRTSDTILAVKYTPCAEEQTDDELEEIAIVSRDNSNEKKPSELDVEQSVTVTVNGPRLLPGVGVFHSPSDRTKLIGERLSSQLSLPSPVYSNKVVEQTTCKSTSKQSLLDIVSNRIDKAKQRTRSGEDIALMRKIRPTEPVTTREIRKQRKKEITQIFGNKRQRQQERIETSTNSSDKSGCKWTFVFDPSGRLSYWWSAVVSIAFLYNFWVLIYRFAFQEIRTETTYLWFTLDYTADFLYILDIAFHFRTGFLDEGVLQTDATKLRIHYMNTTRFYIDCLCLLPLDFLYLSIGFCSILRGFRLVKVYRFWTFLDRTERHTNYPNVIRTTTLMHYLLALFHWNACLYYIIVYKIDKATADWGFPKDESDVLKQYLHALYWSTLTLTTIGDLPMPRSTGAYLFIIFELMFGLLLFATVLGHIANIVSCVSAARKDFQAKLDGVKTYMTLRRVPLILQDRVIKWFDYLWMCNKSTDEERTLSLLPDKLKAEIAIHVHLDTLKRVEIFQNTEAGFLCELVLRLRPVLFSPGDYICRKGEVGKEMYIVNRGRLQVVADNGKTVLATLKPGSYFGEISILNMGTAGNRRTASVRSVGYSDLFCLSKQDLWDVLKEYPAARVKLESIAVKRLEKYKKAPLEKAALARSKSTPGLVESLGQVPVDVMTMHRHHTLPAGLPKTQNSSAPSRVGSIHSNSGRSDNGDETRKSDMAAGPETSNGHVNEVVRIQEETMSKEFHEDTSSICTLATSLTISSISSMIAVNSSPMKSPLCTDNSRSVFSPPTSPHLLYGSHTEQSQTQTMQTLLPEMSIGTPPRVVPSPVSTHPYHQQITPFCLQPTSFTVNTTPQVSTYFTPFCASNYSPSTPTFSRSVAGSIPSSQTNLCPPLSPFPPPLSVSPYPGQAPSIQLSPLPGSSVTGSFTGSLTSPRDMSHDLLLQEISSLRERLNCLESENAAMTVKLNQQQWDVEHRLAEIEMHMCGSDSVASIDESLEEKSGLLEPVNRESII